MVVKVAVVGAGIIGLSSATVIQERFPDLSVTLFAEKFSPGTTSDGAAGLWWPYLVAGTPQSDIYEYGKGTWKYLEKLWNSPEGGKLGVSLIPCVQVSDSLMEKPIVSDFVYGFQTLGQEELISYKQPHWKHGFRFVTYICEGSRLLPHLLDKFRNQKGIVVAKKVKSLEELAGHFDIVINCTGLGANELIDDKLVHPIRGHIFRVKAPWQKTIIMDESEHGNYIIPNQETIVLGGTHDKDQWDLTPRQVDAEFILKGCRAILPSLEKAEIVYEWVGLRPGRIPLRVEREKVTIKGKCLTVIHDYGHGGSGLTLFHGCALKVADLLEKTLAESVTSKL